MMVYDTHCVPSVRAFLSYNMNTIVVKKKFLCINDSMFLMSFYIFGIKQYIVITIYTYQLKTKQFTVFTPRNS